MNKPLQTAGSPGGVTSPCVGALRLIRCSKASSDRYFFSVVLDGGRMMDGEW